MPTCSAICFAWAYENDTLRRLLIFICSLSRSGIASPIWENGGFLSFADAARTRCIVRRMFFMVTHERPCSGFFQIHSLTESMLMCSMLLSPCGCATCRKRQFHCPCPRTKLPAAWAACYRNVAPQRKFAKCLAVFRNRDHVRTYLRARTGDTNERKKAKPEPRSHCHFIVDS